MKLYITTEDNQNLFDCVLNENDKKYIGMYSLNDIKNKLNYVFSGCDTIIFDMNSISDEESVFINILKTYDCLNSNKLIFLCSDSNINLVKDLVEIGQYNIITSKTYNKIIEEMKMCLSENGVNKDYINSRIDKSVVKTDNIIKEKPKKNKKSINKPTKVKQLKEYKKHNKPKEKDKTQNKKIKLKENKIAETKNIKIAVIGTANEIWTKTVAKNISKFMIEKYNYRSLYIEVKGLDYDASVFENNDINVLVCNFGVLADVCVSDIEKSFNKIVIVNNDKCRNDDKYRDYKNVINIDVSSTGEELSLLYLYEIIRKDKKILVN